ncbi:ribosomal protection-like ABC-F family protein [Streptomyces daghestanicus]|uniref:ABC transporter ATP-binding protein n=1 Tax=Streptomyces daghestanicus TaxID=66885 RepID=A0ABQ3QCM5_9ACTN|nr:ABC-F family ATP-binding cassette domain-containing protein [Streptomyces daghestanicus]GGU55991.1 ABC transporter ATP-binding protein [Streptomyces daghestanicus]GHI34977.1 ABC transporter ATP-binding protein [Streptomyces daghestanicus]
MPSQLTLSHVSKVFGDHPVLDQVSFSIRPGDTVGVVGENGAGKTTLLRLMAGVEQPDEGTVTLDTEGGVGLLGQTLDLPAHYTVRDAVDWALADLRETEARLRSLESGMATATRAELDAYGELLHRFEARGGYTADARAAAMLDELGIGHIPFDRPLGALSGGEQSRLALACMLATEPGLLLLDEPSNHLDDRAMAWLENRLRDFPGTVVAVSHDRVFLERVTETILEVDGDRHTVNRYGNGYAGYLEEKAAARRRWEEAYQNWLDDMEFQRVRSVTTAHRVGYANRFHSNKLQYFNHGLRAERQVGSRVRNALERLRRLEEDPVPRPPDPLRFTAGLAGTGRTFETPLVTLTDVVVGDRLRVGSLSIGQDSRLLVQGPNGAGKTTLLDVIAGVLEPDEGEVVRQGRISYLPQEVSVGKPQQPLLAAFAEGRAGTEEEHREQLASLGLFDPDTFHVPVGELSVGQQRRLVLARLVVEPADLLLLDEPTNHLALTLLEELEDALALFPGAVVIVSHDRRLRSRFRGEPVDLRDGVLRRAQAAGTSPAAAPDA